MAFSQNAQKNFLQRLYQGDVAVAGFGLGQLDRRRVYTVEIVAIEYADRKFRLFTGNIHLGLHFCCVQIDCAFIMYGGQRISVGEVVQVRDIGF